MIIFCPAMGIMLSDLYGMDGSSELRTIAKKMRLDASMLRSQGHPTQEHYRVPEAKFDGMVARGAKIVASEHISTLMQQKVAISTQKIIVKPKKYQKSPDDAAFQENSNKNNKNNRNQRRFRADRRQQKEFDET